MAGIAVIARLGDTHSADAGRRQASIVEAMIEMLDHKPWYERDVSAGDNRVSGGTSLYFPPDWRRHNRHTSEGLDVWLEGEIYNTDDWLEPSVEAHLASDTPGTADILAARYRADAGWDYLAEADGIYSGAIYDARNGQLHLFCDRHGFQLLFWGRIGETIVWSSEVKAFLAHPDFEPSIRDSSIEHFFEDGYLHGDETWFEGVHLLESATVRSWDLDTGRGTSQTYWHWEDIERRSDSPSLSTIAPTLGHHIREAVEQRCRGDHRLGVTLSGGLDSRAILASIPRDDVPLSATFGIPNSSDVQIARQVADHHGVHHLTWTLREDNWFQCRTEGVWFSDGHLPLRHMHGLPLQRALQRHCDLNLNGFLGGNIPGGSYLEGDDHPPVETIENRGRRFISEGVRVAETFLRQRRPLVAHDVIDYAYSLPRELLEEGRAYRAALLHEFPDAFRDIPYDETGMPISTGPLEARLRNAWQDVVTSLQHPLGGGTSHAGERYANYPRWLIGPSQRSHFEELLFGADRIYPKYISERPVRRIWSRVSRGDTTCDWDEIYNVLTFETWLRQVFRGELRPDDS